MSAARADEVLADAIVEAADDAFDTLSDMIDAAREHGTEWPLLHVVPCIPGEPIPAGAVVTGMKLARVAGAIGIYLFAEPAA